MIGKAILHYKILEKLGQGGMGIVYLAEDTKLERQVAIKFLPHHIAGNTDERKRFETEAKAAAALNHPNIATIHAIEESENEMFLVMEYIEGIELKQQIDRGKLGIERTVDIAIQIAEGLQAAHKKGIAHRDIKSSNIMLTVDGKVKIMDFGLAKFRSSTPAKAGTTVGTAAYMSPEMSNGEEADHRTDIWSFGIVVYEMIAGQLPFQGDYELAVLYAIVNEPPKPLSDYIKGIPKVLETVIDKCLMKDVEERYQNIESILQESIFKSYHSISSEAIEELEDVKSSVKIRKTHLFALITLFVVLAFFVSQIVFINEPDIAKQENSNILLKRIAVLPFNNLNNNPESNYLGFALSDRIISSLAYIEELLVRPSRSVRPYQNIEVETKSIAEKLKVDYILSGNYLKENDMVRLSLELIDVKTNNLIWHEGIELPFENTFKLQDLVSQKVVDNLKIHFSSKSTDDNSTNNPAAYEYFLRALSYPLSLEGHQLSIEMFKKSIELDSTFAPAYAELGFRLHLIASYDLNERSRLEDAEKAYEKALAINKNLLTGLSQLAVLYTEKNKAVKAVELIKKALAINPNNAGAHFWLGYIYRYTGLLKESVEEMEKAVALDPGNPRFRSLGVTYIYQQQFEKALIGLNLDEESTYTKAWKGNIYLRKSQFAKAKKYLSDAITQQPGGSLGTWSKAMLYYIDGEIDKGLEMIRKLETSDVFDGEQFYNYANLYGLYGKKEDCIRVLKKAVESGFYCYPFLLNDSFLNNVRNDDAFQKILIDAKEKHESFKKKFFLE
ncbi:MAG: tetratricopeptide repeat protein [Calditrichaeota bacterium]|nr:MAG: tetratricopeptide repeat protein [Calditrichota bacterium]MBL1203878.1 tetratricopeptide repeat protein [Calditrichota bacterium]NOG43710.1 protein kinase [Calditrichota bacterium]